MENWYHRLHSIGTNTSTIAESATAPRHSWGCADDHPSDAVVRTIQPKGTALGDRAHSIVEIGGISDLRSDG
jgi:hypothetical protein